MTRGPKPGTVKRPPGAGRKKGTRNKPKPLDPLSLDAVETLRKMGHDPMVVQINIYRHSWNRYLKALKNRNEWGANGALMAASKANAEILKYIYPTRKAVDHVISGNVAVTYAGLAQQLLGDSKDERDVSGDEGEEKT